MSSVIAQFVLTMICYEMSCCKDKTNRINFNNFDSNDFIYNENLDLCLDQANIYRDVNYETFSFLLLTNILLYEGSTIIDCSLILGNQIDTLLSGLMVVFTLYYQIARHL